MDTLTPLLEGVKIVLQPHEELNTHFEETLRSSISACDLSQLLSQKVPFKTIVNSFSSALQSTSESALIEFERTQEPKFRSIADQLWNPLIASMLRCVVPSPVVAAQSRPSPPTVPEKSKSPKPKDLKRNSPAPKLEPDSLSRLQEKLRAVALTRDYLYRTPFHSHVKCGRPRCRFCRHMFFNLNITRCEGHKPCCSVGWYPHFGPGLWSVLRRRHNSDETCRIAPKDCNAHELPALGQAPVDDFVGSEVPSTSPVSVRAMEHSATPSPRPTSPSYRPEEEPPAPLDWAEDVEQYVARRLLAKRRAQAAEAGSPEKRSASADLAQ